MITQQNTYNYGTLAIQVYEAQIDTIEKEIIVTIDKIKKRYYLDSATWDGFSQQYLLTYKEYQE